MAEANKAISLQANLQELLQRISEKQQAIAAITTETTSAAPPETTAEAVIAAPATFAASVFNPPAEIAASSQSFDALPVSATAQPNVNALTDAAIYSSRFPVGEELILALSVNGVQLTDILVYKSQQLFLLGLGDFFQIVEYPIYVDLTQKAANGWFLNERNVFSLKPSTAEQLEVNLQGKVFNVSAANYQLRDDDIYMEIAEIANWFDFSVELDEARLSVNIVSKSKFPVEARAARRTRMLDGYGGVSRSVMPEKESPYTVFTAPLLDIQLAAKHANDKTRSNYSVLANQDLAYFNAELFLAGADQNLLQDARLTLSKQSTNANLLGPLRATEFTLGDVTPVNAGFGRTQGLSRGIAVSNTPLSQLADNRKVNLTGDVQVGWDVELYRNGVLLDRSISVADGRYEFNDVELSFGSNDFELVFYGPQGQIETKVESYIVDSNVVASGESTYRVSVVNAGKSLFAINDYYKDPANTGILAGAIFDYGITDWLAYSAGTSWFMPEQGEIQQYYTLGANLSLGKYGLLNSAISVDRNNRQTTNHNFRTRFWDSSWSFSYRQDQLFNTERSVLDNRNDTLSVTMNGRLAENSTLPLSYQNSWYRTNYHNGITMDNFANAIGFNSRYGSFSHNLNWNKSSQLGQLPDTTQLPGTDNELLQASLLTSTELSGGFQYRKSFGKLFTRFYSNYAIKPEAELLSYGGAFTYRWASSLNSDVRMSYLVPTDQFMFNLGLNWQHDDFLLNTNVDYDFNGDWSVGMALRFSLGYASMQNTVFTSGRMISRSGAAAVRVFEDLNMNGVFDEGEPLFDNVEVKAVQGYKRGITNSDGVAILSALANNVKTDIIVDAESIDGPFMITAIPGVAITARKGYLEQLDFPIVKAGELEGVIYLKNDAGEAAPAPYILLNLINETNEVVGSTRSEFDGMYLFNNIKPGRYNLKVDDAYIDRRELKTVREKQLRFSSDGDLIVGVDFVLAPLDNAEGYVVSVGQFKSARMLKLYYHILRRKLAVLYGQKPFYIKSRQTGQFVLGVAYFEDDPNAEGMALQQAQRSCDNFLQADIKCTVEYHGFKY
ncbi:sporulation protein [Rheinheimera sp. D18]|uniref:sporulation protein n=1 Tax=Rheinheimera sp. D18 TaxID=2545632 RepID=UPI0010525EF5|nr:sporulation protein [Rheinheimera sp. D18]QBL09934.1 sporulation protein [Rheinheimera sp. D18]